MPDDPQSDWVLARLRALGARIRDARIRADLTQEELAERADTSWRTIHRIEYGHPGTSIATLLRVAQVLRVPLSDMLTP